MHSMTGFAQATSTRSLDGKELIVGVQLKSVNAKGCDVSVRAPHALAALEIALIKYLKARFKRGTISCYISMQGSGAQKLGELSQAAVVHYYKQLENACVILNIVPDIAVRDLLQFPGVIIDRMEKFEGGECEELVWACLEEASGLLEKELSVEGVQSASCMLGHIATVRLLFSAVKQAFGPLNEMRTQKLQALAREASGGGEINDAVAAELFRHLEKYDLSEEMQRFEVHLDRFEALIKNHEHEKGRHGDFLVQELFREIGTTGAKCNSSEISQSAIAIKMELEKIREQLCNVA